MMLRGSQIDAIDVKATIIATLASIQYSDPIVSIPINAHTKTK